MATSVEVVKSLVSFIHLSNHFMFILYITGEQLGSDGGCEACPRGTWRATSVSAACVSCPPGTTTPQGGASSADQCSLPVCKPGKYQFIFKCV